MTVRSTVPLQDVIRKVDHSGRLSKWCIDLGEDNITYEPRRAIKAQALADFIVEVLETEGTLGDLRSDEAEWTLFIDGALGSEHQGAGVILCGPEGMEASKSIKFNFNVTNNIAEYEGLTGGL